MIEVRETCGGNETPRGSSASPHLSCCLLERERAGRVLNEAFFESVFQLAAADAPVEVAAGRAPFENICDAALGFHAASAIVKVGKLVCDLCVQGQQCLFADSNFLC